MSRQAPGLAVAGWTVCLVTVAGNVLIAAAVPRPTPASRGRLTHLTYLNRYQNAAASFVLGRIGG